MTESARSNGAALIAAERERQIEAEGWTPEHDDTHTSGEIVRAAVTYALPEARLVTVGDNGVRWRSPWPWASEDRAGRSLVNTPKHTDRIRDLVKAGALIAAEIDRLQRGQA